MSEINTNFPPPEIEDEHVHLHMLSALNSQSVYVIIIPY